MYNTFFLFIFYIDIFYDENIKFKMIIIDIEKVEFLLQSD